MTDLSRFQPYLPNVLSPAGERLQLMQPGKGLLRRMESLLNDQATQLSRLHRSFLESRQSGLNHLAALITRDLHSLGDSSPVSLPRPASGRAMYSRAQLEEFASGEVERCLGTAYAVYRGRRLPRIPNGRFLFMDRITNLTGVPGELSGGCITAEYEYLPGTWFGRRGVGLMNVDILPNAVVMEIALQPCGFLSAWLKTPLLEPDADWYFRNLDGSAQLLKALPRPGSTIRTDVRLAATTPGAGMILQVFDFVCSSNGSAFYEGSASFGYFPPEALAAQSGLDGDSTQAPWKEPARESSMLTRLEKLDDLESPLEAGFSDVVFDTESGTYGLGYLYASRKVRPSDWYFSVHFHQDPVMPGSLGVEALLTLFWKLLELKVRRGGASNISPAIVPARPLVWKYRGQVLPSNHLMEFEVHITSSETQGAETTWYASGSAWIDGSRIYDIKNMAYMTSVNPER